MNKPISKDLNNVKLKDLTPEGPQMNKLIQIPWTTAFIGTNSKPKTSVPETNRPKLKYVPRRP